MAKNKIDCIICYNSFNYKDFAACPHCGFEPNTIKVQTEVLEGDGKLILTKDFITKKKSHHDN